MTTDRDFAGLLEDARAGDLACLDALVRSIERPLVGFLRGRRVIDPEGIANETLLRACRGLRGFEGDEAGFRSWVFQIARNLVIDEHRRRSRRPDAVATEPNDLPDAGVEPAEIDQVGETERIEALLDALTDQQREVLLLRIVADLSVEETAEATGMRPGAVRSMQHRAVTRLRKAARRAGQRADR